jgi:hypothetical protein
VRLLALLEEIVAASVLLEAAGRRHPNAIVGMHALKQGQPGQHVRMG